MARTGPFDAHYRKYEQWFMDNRYVYQSELKAIGHLLPAAGEGMEIGVGSGRFASPFGIRIGVEPSPAMRRLARAKGIDVREGVAEALPFPDESFGFVLMVTTICFVDDPGACLREARRVLKSGGVFVVGFVLSLLEGSRFARLEMIQTVFGELGGIRAVQPVRSGHGTGGFVAMRSAKGC
jgi:SAM-dependent methyltransferase